MVRYFLVLATLSIGAALPAKADSCADLVKKAEQGLVQQGLDDSLKSQLEMLLEVGRSGDLAICEQATTGSLLTPRPTGYKCDKSDKTV
jgi:hypothetical protein